VFDGKSIGVGGAGGWGLAMARSCLIPERNCTMRPNSVTTRHRSCTTTEARLGFSTGSLVTEWGPSRRELLVQSSRVPVAWVVGWVSAAFVRSGESTRLDWRERIPGEVSYDSVRKGGWVVGDEGVAHGGRP
jgi:hypothetical protein